MSGEPTEAGSNEGSVEAVSEASHDDTEPNTSGTLFLTLIFLMMIFGFWMMMYIILLNR